MSATGPSRIGSHKAGWLCDNRNIMHFALPPPSATPTFLFLAGYRARRSLEASGHCLPAGQAKRPGFLHIEMNLTFGDLDTESAHRN